MLFPPPTFMHASYSSSLHSSHFLIPLLLLIPSFIPLLHPTYLYPPTTTTATFILSRLLANGGEFFMRRGGFWSVERARCFSGLVGAFNVGF
ncbi:hypothetical protein Pcinc_040180 [Petrolisthes cinctipes]|uniref:Uncharacterized protein n=1 Tax=Petrolisthes cinctipes TaxID=88211 RepID=A0AAE1EJT7_PETCI|nr:hypothetical protein Pcinc_040180 [Petrolisthes cinctipes]